MDKLFLGFALLASLSAQAADFSGSWRGVAAVEYCDNREFTDWACQGFAEQTSCNIEIRVDQSAGQLALSQDFRACGLTNRFDPPAIVFEVVGEELLNRGVFNGAVRDGSLVIDIDRCQFAADCAFRTAERLEMLTNADGSANMTIRARGFYTDGRRPYDYKFTARLTRY